MICGISAMFGNYEKTAKEPLVPLVFSAIISTIFGDRSRTFITAKFYNSNNNISLDKNTGEFITLHFGKRG